MAPVLEVVSPEHYLHLERGAEIRSELIDGQIVAMSGESAAHSIVKGNIIASAKWQWSESECIAFDSDMRVRVPNGSYFYPDASFVCDPVYEDERRDTLLNPVAVVEVLSPSTAHRDRQAKFDWYGLIPTLKEYMLVDTVEKRVEIYQRDGVGWKLRISTGDTEANLESVGLTFSLAQIYRSAPLDR